MPRKKKDGADTMTERSRLEMHEIEEVKRDPVTPEEISELMEMLECDRAAFAKALGISIATLDFWRSANHEPPYTAQMTIRRWSKTARKKRGLAQKRGGKAPARASA